MAVNGEFLEISLASIAVFTVVCLGAITQEPWATVALIAAASVLLVSLAHPHLAFAAFLVSTFVITDVSVKLPGAKLHVTDLFFIVLAATFFKRLTICGTGRLWSVPLVRSCACLSILAAGAGLYGWARGNMTVLIFSELRPWAYYLTVVPAYIFLRERKVRDSLLRIIFVGSLGAILLGIERCIANPARTGGTTFELGFLEFGRLVSPLLPTFLPVYVALICITLLADREGRHRLLLKASIAVCGIAIFLSLTRSSVLAFFVALLAGVFLARRELWSPKRALWVVCLAVGSIVAADFASGQAFSGRISRATESDDLNILQRLYETSQVVDRIAERPILGSGMGALHSSEYLLQPPEDQRFWLNPTICHNSYLYAWWKMGLPGLVAVVLALFSGIRACYRVFRRSEERRDRLWGLIAFQVLLAVIVISISSPELYDEATVPLFTTLFAMIAILSRKTSPLGWSQRAASVTLPA